VPVQLTYLVTSECEAVVVTDEALASAPVVATTPCPTQNDIRAILSAS